MKNLCISYPKSGRTWLRVMFEQLGVPLAFTHLDTGHDKKSWGKPVEEIGIPTSDADRVVFLHRDPRDTVVSYFYETTIRQKPKLKRAIRYFVQGRRAPKDMPSLVRSPRFGIEKIIVFNLLCAEHLKALPVAYEDLREDTVGQVSAMLDHIGVNRPKGQIMKVVENNSFAKMHQREATGAYGRLELEARDRNNQNSFKVRRGKVGGWQDELDPATQEFVNRMLDQYRYFERMREMTGPYLR